MKLTAEQLRVRRAARRAAKRHGINPQVFDRQIRQESGYNPRAQSPAGAMGAGQLMPGTAQGLGVRDPWDVEQNLDGAARYLAQQLRTFNGDYKLALAAYNAGPGNVQKYGGVPPFAETQNYVKTILGGSAPKATPAKRTPKQSSGRLVGGKAPSLQRGGTKIDQSGALVAALLDPRKDMSLLKRYDEQIATGNFTTTTKSKVTPGKPAKYLGGKAKASAPKQAQGRGNPVIHELIWNGPGAINIKDGQRTGPYADGHTDHVHLAANPKAMRRAAKLAQEMGLAVREYSPIDPVDPVHSENSYHYRRGGKGAMDVSGARMAEWAKRVSEGRF